MGGGDLNMKKSWHPLLMKNQERVWLEEKKALEERKKLDQLRKEKEEERQLQELQRLQEEQTGRKRQERLDWMYATPAAGNSASTNDMEDYLLGKRRVDKVLIGEDNAKLGATHHNFIAVQNANTQRDILAKVREDPLLAIKQQEQAAYQSLISNPLRVRELKAKAGLDKKDKKPKKDKKEKKRRDREHRIDPDSRCDSRSPSPPRRRYSRSHSPRRSSRDDRRPTAYERGRWANSRSRSPPSRRVRSRSRSVGARRDSRYSPAPQGRVRSRTPPQRSGSRDGHRRGSPGDVDHLRRPPTPPSVRPPVHPSRAAFIPNLIAPARLQPANPTPAQSNADRAARLAAMTATASSVAVERQHRLTDLIGREQAELAAEEAARIKSAKHHGAGNFLAREKAQALYGPGQDLGERLRRNRAALVGVD